MGEWGQKVVSFTSRRERLMIITRQSFDFQEAWRRYFNYKNVLLPPPDDLKG